MKKLTAIGYWDSHIKDDFIWPQEIVSDNVKYKEEIAEYLKNGNTAIQWQGHSGCRICQKTLGSKCLTDGKYIWPEKLEHYVIEHNVQLPEKFIKHMKSKNFSCDVVKIKVIKSVNYDWWTEWCKKHRRPELNPRNLVEVFQAPTKSGEGVFSARIASDLFVILESHDYVVKNLYLDTKERFEEKGINCLDIGDDGESDHFWTAEVHYKGELISITDETEKQIASLIFEDDKIVFYVNNKNHSLMKGEEPEIRFAPNLTKPQ